METLVNDRSMDYFRLKCLSPWFPSKNLNHNPISTHSENSDLLWPGGRHISAEVVTWVWDTGRSRELRYHKSWSLIPNLVMLFYSATWRAWNLFLGRCDILKHLYLVLLPEIPFQLFSLWRTPTQPKCMISWERLKAPKVHKWLSQHLWAIPSSGMMVRQGLSKEE